MGCDPAHAINDDSDPVNSFFHQQRRSASTGSKEPLLFGLRTNYFLFTQRCLVAAKSERSGDQSLPRWCSSWVPPLRGHPVIVISFENGTGLDPPGADLPVGANDPRSTSRRARTVRHPDEVFNPCCEPMVPQSAVRSSASWFETRASLTCLLLVHSGPERLRSPLHPLPSLP